MNWNIQFHLFQSLIQFNIQLKHLIQTIVSKAKRGSARSGVNRPSTGNWNRVVDRFPEIVFFVYNCIAYD